MPASKQPRKRKAPAASATPTPPAPAPPASTPAARIHTAPLSDEIPTQADARAAQSHARPTEAPPASPPAYLRREPDAPIKPNRGTSSAANRDRMSDVFYMLSGVDPGPPGKPSS